MLAGGPAVGDCHRCPGESAGTAFNRIQAGSPVGNTGSLSEDLNLIAYPRRVSDAWNLSSQISSFVTRP